MESELNPVCSEYVKSTSVQGAGHRKGHYGSIIKRDRKEKRRSKGAEGPGPTLASFWDVRNSTVRTDGNWEMLKKFKGDDAYVGYLQLANRRNHLRVGARSESQTIKSAEEGPVAGITEKKKGLWHIVVVGHKKEGGEKTEVWKPPYP